MLVGPHGAGKTSTLAKLATELTLAGEHVVLISTDMERLGGAEALQKVAEILKCDFYACEKRQQLKILLQQYLGKAWVLIDSAGANIYEFAQMKQLGEFAGLQGVEPILTCPAGMDADEAAEMASVFDFLSIDRMLITRLDAARRLKSMFTTITTGGYALAGYTHSAIPSDALQSLTPIALSRLMLRHARERLPQ
jgi:flagellar biosynthesis protein FlhF